MKCNWDYKAASRSYFVYISDIRYVFLSDLMLQKIVPKILKLGGKHSNLSVSLKNIIAQNDKANPILILKITTFKEDAFAYISINAIIRVAFCRHQMLT